MGVITFINYDNDVLRIKTDEVREVNSDVDIFYDKDILIIELVNGDVYTIYFSNELSDMEVDDMIDLIKTKFLLGEDLVIEVESWDKEN